MSFKINDIEQKVTVPTLTVELIGHFSIDGNLQYHDDLSQLKYVIRPSNLDNTNFDLTKNNGPVHHSAHLHIKLDNILKWICDNHHRIDKPLSVEKDRWFDIDFICSRGVIKKILSSPYSYGDDWTIYASKYRGTIYLCHFYSDETEYHYANKTKMDKLFESRGFKFEQYMVAGTSRYV
ncbi:hypothetical protein PUN28_013158 [Cardiocondyla obscurior]|uniref:Decapping nuclease n=1 Tax=Cardiocondyla obscurior TaxID=286306 RepID=A0AAW2FC66_9HYME